MNMCSGTASAGGLVSTIITAARQISISNRADGVACTNDKRVMANDTYPYDLVHNRVHEEREFRTFNSLGQPSKWQGE